MMNSVSEWYIMGFNDARMEDQCTENSVAVKFEFDNNDELKKCDVGFGTANFYFDDGHPIVSTRVGSSRQLPMKITDASLGLDKLHCVDGEGRYCTCNHGGREVEYTVENGGRSWRSVHRGERHTVLVDADHEAYSYLETVPVPLGLKVAEVSCGKEHVLMLDQSGRVFSMGCGSRGQLGHGDLDSHPSRPRLVETLDGLVCTRVMAGGWHSCAITDCGDLFIWGWNQSGQLGIVDHSSESDSDASLRTTETTDWATRDSKPVIQMVESNKSEGNNAMQDGESSAEIGKNESLAYGVPSFNQQKESDSSKLESGDLAMALDSTTTTKEDCCLDRKHVDLPVSMLAEPSVLEVDGGKPVLDVACGSRHTVAFTTDNNLYVWGWNKYGQLGLPNPDPLSLPALDSCPSPDTVYQPTLNSWYRDRGLAVCRVYAGYWTTVVEAVGIPSS